MIYYYRSVGEKEFFIHLLISLFYTFIISTVIAVLLLLVGFGRFFENFVITQSIGFLACCCAVFSIHSFRPDKKATYALTLIPAILIGISAGTILGFKLAGLGISVFFQQSFFLRQFSLTLIFGVAISYFFFSKGMMASKEKLIQEERLKRLEMEKTAVEVNLRLLRAQIEPHFLFNTLSNILSLRIPTLARESPCLKT